MRRNTRGICLKNHLGPLCLKTLQVAYHLFVDSFDLLFSYITDGYNLS
jgi:hypothetical protein